VVFPEPLGPAMTISLGRNGFVRFEKLYSLLTPGCKFGFKIFLDDVGDDKSLGAYTFSDRTAYGEKFFVGQFSCIPLVGSMFHGFPH